LLLVINFLDHDGKKSPKSLSQLDKDILSTTIYTRHTLPPEDKSVAAPRNCFDVFVIVKRPPYLRDVLCRIALFQKGSQPDLLYQLVLAQDSLAVFDKSQQPIKDLWRESYNLPATHQ
jgi:hypothetical protein